MRVIGMVSEILIDMVPMMVSGRRWRCGDVGANCDDDGDGGRMVSLRL